MNFFFSRLDSGLPNVLRFVLPAHLCFSREASERDCAAQSSFALHATD
jgi:hypothetical protein